MTAWRKVRVLLVFYNLIQSIYVVRCSARCTSFEWECLNGECISNSTICDVYPDCSDGSDEINCKDTITCSEVQKKCFHSNGNFTCTNSATPCDCGSPGNIMYGTVTLDDPTNSSAGASASVTCNTGYHASTPSLTCLLYGLWTNSSCTPKDCGQLPPMSKGSITLKDPKNTTYGARATVTCFTGYQANVTSVTCLASGLWQSAFCTIIACGQLPPILAGSITLLDPKNTTYGASATVTCFTGYRSNVTSVTCLASGMWESASCTVTDSSLPATSITQNDNNNTILIIVLVLVFGVASFIQLCVATCLYVMIYRTYNSDAGKSVSFILLSAIPYIGIAFIIRFHKWSYKIFHEKAHFNPQQLDIINRNSADNHKRICKPSDKNEDPEAENTDKTRSNHRTSAKENFAITNSDAELHGEGKAYQHLQPERRHSDLYTELRSRNLCEHSAQYTNLQRGNLQKGSDQYTNLQSDDLQNGSDQYTTL